MTSQPPAAAPATAPTAAQVARWVDDAVTRTPVYDLHTHLYPAAFGDFMLWGIDELLTYHYLIAETVRATNIPYEKYWAMSQQQQAELIWRTLFLERAPVGEACRGVITVLGKLGLDVSSKNLGEYRKWYASQKPEEFVGKVFGAANVHTAVMTNNALDPKDARSGSGAATSTRASRACSGSTRCSTAGRASPTPCAVSGTRSARTSAAGR